MTRKKLAARGLALSVCMLLALTACGDDSDTDSTPKALSSLGESENQLTLLAMPGHAERGTSDPEQDWVTAFEKETGCQTAVTTATDVTELEELARTGEYDAVAAPGEISRALIEDEEVAPVNTTLLENYDDVVKGLQNRAWNSAGGDSYGAPVGRSANLLMWRTDKVTTPPTSTATLFDPADELSGSLAAFDSPLTLADYALYLKTARPELGITNPYALSRKQFDAVVAQAGVDNDKIGTYWVEYGQYLQKVAEGAVSMGIAPQAVVEVGKAQGTPIEATLPEQGATGTADTWMITANAQNPNCAYRWLDYTLSPEVNAQAAQVLGVAPAVTTACDKAAPGYCDTFHALDEEYYQKVWPATTPLTQCVAGSGSSCVGVQDWRDAWQNLRTQRGD
ncbi:MAG: extracellular solute-binding protein [Corynebacteriales bacterium]|nr:extracellular solute-binding protein [Mycobacteriales bacterium]